MPKETTIPAPAATGTLAHVEPSNVQKPVPVVPCNASVQSPLYKSALPIEVCKLEIFAAFDWMTDELLWIADALLLIDVVWALICVELLDILELNSNLVTVGDNNVHYVNGLVLPISREVGQLPVYQIGMSWHDTDGWSFLVYFVYNGQHYYGHLKLLDVMLYE